MTNILLQRCVAALLAIFAAGGTNEQHPSDVWVPEINGPHYFAVLVADVDASVAWYRTTLGLKELDGSRADDGSWRIVNLGNDDLAVEIIRDDRAKDVARARGFFKVGFSVPDVREIADRVKRATGERPHVVDDVNHGTRILQLKDPDGNTLQLTSPLEEPFKSPAHLRDQSGGALDE